MVGIGLTFLLRNAHFFRGELLSSFQGGLFGCFQLPEAIKVAIVERGPFAHFVPVQKKHNEMNQKPLAEFTFDEFGQLEIGCLILIWYQFGISTTEGRVEKHWKSQYPNSSLATCQQVCGNSVLCKPFEFGTKRNKAS